MQSVSVVWKLLRNPCHGRRRNFSADSAIRRSMDGYSFKPIGIREANQFIKLYHRHSGPVQGYKFAVSVMTDQGDVVGVGIAGRPIAQALDDRVTLEITRVCVKPGHKNVCSMIYARIRDIGKLMGYQTIITYTLSSESGASLRAIGARQVAVTRPGGWDRKSRSRANRAIYDQPKIRWLL